MKSDKSQQVDDHEGGGEERRSVLARLARHPALDRYRERSWWKTETFLIAGAIVAGLFSAALSHASRESFQSSVARSFTTQSIIVAAKDIPAGTPLSKSLLAPGKVLGAQVTGSYLSVDQLPMILGRTTAIDLRPGDPILVTAVSGVENAEKMAEKVPAGKRLFTLSIGDRSAGLGFVRPNDHVDIITHMDLPNRGPVTFTVLQDITLVAVGASSVLGSQGLGGTDVSFFVNPDEFEVLAFAQNKGRFSLSLRNPNDASKRNVGRGVDLNAFLDNNRISNVSGGGELEVIEGGRKAAPDKPGRK